MKLVELTNTEFTTFVKKQKNASFYQSEEYARFMEEEDFDYNYIGLKDKFDNIIAASLIILKNIDHKYNFGYAPRGFLIDYNDKELVYDFAKALEKYYKKKKVIFIKINPNIFISKYDKEEKKYIYNSNVKFIDILKSNKFQELKKNKYFEALIPTFTPIINLNNFNYTRLSKNVRNKINKSFRKGLSIEKGNFESLKSIYPFIKNKTKKTLKYYENLYKTFEKNNSIDVFMVKVNFEEFLINTKSRYQYTNEKNNIINKIVAIDKSEKMLNRKIQSDKELVTYKNDIITATKGLSKNKYEVVAGAIVIKYNNMVTIFASGYNVDFKELNSTNYLYYKIMEYYKYEYDFLDLNGFSGDLSQSNPYSGLNNFKLGFNPDIYEDIGEFDIIFNKRIYKKISSNGTLAKMFSKLK